MIAIHVHIHDKDCIYLVLFESVHVNVRALVRMCVCELRLYLNKAIMALKFIDAFLIVIICKITISFIAV